MRANKTKLALFREALLARANQTRRSGPRRYRWKVPHRGLSSASFLKEFSGDAYPHLRFAHDVALRMTPKITASLVLVSVLAKAVQCRKLCKIENDAPVTQL